jgi:NADH dehydrogenase FAD-containing subunit
LDLTVGLDDWTVAGRHRLAHSRSGAAPANTHVLLGTVTGADRARKHVLMGARNIAYDVPVLATGRWLSRFLSHPSTFIQLLLAA